MKKYRCLDSANSNDKDNWFPKACKNRLILENQRLHGTYKIPGTDEIMHFYKCPYCRGHLEEIKED